MNMKRRILSIDIGTSNGRAMIAEYDENKINMKEIYRFKNQPVMTGGTVYWDILNIFREVKIAMCVAHRDGGFESVGITSWGSDFGLLDKYDDLIGNPVHFADARTKGMADKVFDYLPKEKVYAKTGVQVSNANTIYQLMSLRDKKPTTLKRARTLLLIPDLLNFMLTGMKASERTIASTTQILNINSQKWDYNLMIRLGLPWNILTSIVDPGEVVGQISGDICEELNIPTAKVIAVCSSDFQSSLLSVPSKEKDFISIDAGGWSTMGTELEKPIVTRQTEKFNLSNHTGYNYSSYLNKKIWSLGIIKKLRKQWATHGEEFSFSDLALMAEESEPFKCFIDPDLDIFITSRDCVFEITNYCTQSKQFIPTTPAQIMRCVYDSIAMKYKHVYNHMKACTGKIYSSCHIVGMGSVDEFLCSLTANALGLKVTAGPADAASVGNSLAQLISAGAVPNVETARALVEGSFETKVYTPQDTEEFEQAYTEFKKVIKYQE